MARIELSRPPKELPFLAAGIHRGAIWRKRVLINATGCPSGGCIVIAIEAKYRHVDRTAEDQRMVAGLHGEQYGVAFAFNGSVEVFLFHLLGQRDPGFPVHLDATDNKRVPPWKTNLGRPRCEN